MNEQEIERTILEKEREELQCIEEEISKFKIREKYELEAYEQENTETQRSNRRRYFAKWLDEGKVICKKIDIRKWMKMKKRYWKIDCLRKSEIKPDIKIIKGKIKMSENFNFGNRTFVVQWQKWKYIILQIKKEFKQQDMLNRLDRIDFEQENEEWQSIQSDNILF